MRVPGAPQTRPGAAPWTRLSTQHSALSTQRSPLAILLLVTLAGLALRLFAIDHGLPHQYVPDESTMVGGALRMGASKSLQPSTFIYPALLMYLFAAEYLGLLVVGRLTGVFPSMAHFQEYAFTDPTLFYLLPRLAIALMGAATVPLAYLLGRRLYGSGPGLVAAFLVATSVMHVQMSHQARHWVPVTLLALVILWVSLDLAARGRGRDYWLSGLLVGLVAATSFNGFLLMVLPLAAHLVWVRRRGADHLDPGGKEEVLGTPQPPPGAAPWTRLSGTPQTPPGAAPWTRSWTSGGGAPWTSPRLHLPALGTILLAPAVFFLLNPYLLLQFDQFAAFQASDQRNSIGSQILGHYDSYLQHFLDRQGFTFYGWAALSYEPAITLLGVVGAILAARRFRSTAFLVLVYPLFHYIIFSTTAPSMEQRYMLPAIVLWALPAGLAGERALAWLYLKRGKRVIPPLRAILPVAAVALVLAALVSLPSLRYSWVLSQADTRTLAREWIESNIPAGADVAVQSYPPPLTPDLETLRTIERTEPASLGARDRWLLEKGLPPGEAGYRIARLNLVDTSPQVDHLSPYLATHHHRYFVISDFRWKTQHQGHQALKRYLERHGRLIATFAPSPETAYVPSDILNNMENPLAELWRVERPGPTIQMYEVSR